MTDIFMVLGNDTSNPVSLLIVAVSGAYLAYLGLRMLRGGGVMKYRKRPVKIEARQWDGTYAGGREIVNWIRSHPERHSWITADLLPSGLRVCTLEGPIDASPGDWIVKDLAGEFYPCKPDMFDSAGWKSWVPLGLAEIHAADRKSNRKGKS